MTAWLFILNNPDAVDWVFSNRRMAFRSLRAPATRVKRGDSFAIYLSTRALVPYVGSHNRALDFGPRIVAVGDVASDVQRRSLRVAGLDFQGSCRLDIQTRVDPIEAPSFKELIPDLTFITKKDKWQFFVFRTLIPLPMQDFGTLSQAVIQHPG
jgi:hypothetical protein